MTDITKCSGEGCSKRDDCYRYASMSNNHQAWLDPAECLKNDFAFYYSWKILDRKEKTP